MATRLPLCNDCDTPDEVSTQYLNEKARAMDLDSVFKRHLNGAPLGCEDNTSLFDPAGDDENDWSVVPKADDICDALEMKDDLVRNIRARAIRAANAERERQDKERKAIENQEVNKEPLPPTESSK